MSPGGVGTIGYCMGGRHVLCAAGHFPERVIASASLHGTSLISDAPDSPHRLVKQFRGEVYCGFAEKDPYALPNRDIFHPGGAARDWEMIFAMFHRMIPPYAMSR